jgi:Tol biopolymer transport system component
MKTATALVFGVLVLTGVQCSVGGQEPGEETTAATHTSSTTSRRTESSDATPTATPAIPTSTPETTNLTVRCASPQNSLPEDEAPLGVVILMSGGLDGTSSIYAMDLDSGTLNLIAGGANVSVYSAAISPDRRWLAYETLRHPDLSQEFVLSSADGRTEASPPWDQTWLWISGSEWLNNEQVLLRQRTDRHDSLVAVNPFTGNLLPLPDDFPGIYPFLHEAGWKTVFQPTLGLVLYQGYRGDQAGLTLWDIGSSREVVFVPREINPWSRPVWSADGARYVFSNVRPSDDRGAASPPVEQIFVGTADGRISQITNLGTHFTRATFGELSWSPDGRTVAFWLRATPIVLPVDYPLSPVDNLESASRLGMVDVETGAVTLLCIPQGAPGGAPVWSPSSRYILADYSLGSNSVVWLVDIARYSAVALAVDEFSAGWMLPP